MIYFVSFGLEVGLDDSEQIKEESHVEDWILFVEVVVEMKEGSDDLEAELVIDEGDHFVSRNQIWF